MAAKKKNDNNKKLHKNNSKYTYVFISSYSRTTIFFFLLDKKKKKNLLGWNRSMVLVVNDFRNQKMMLMERPKRPHMATHKKKIHMENTNFP